MPSLFLCLVSSAFFLLSSATCNAFLLCVPLTDHPFPSRSSYHLYAHQEHKKGSKLSGPTVQPPRPNDNTYWVIPNGLIAGEYPGDKRGEPETREKLRRYVDLNITSFFDLTHPGEKADYEDILKDEAAKKGIQVEYRRFPIPDFGIPANNDLMTNILDEIDAAMKERNHTSYVHCRGGIGRTGTTVGCYLVRYGHSGSEALNELHRLFQSSGRSYESPSSPETNEQRRFVREWED
jgi:protein-tyrosine phosphatase